MAESDIEGGGTMMKKYVPGCDDDGEDIFDFPFTKDEKSMDFLKEHGRIMFIVRGPPGTGKSTLSQILCNRYPDGIVCCADNYFKNSFTSPQRNRDSLAKSHLYCHKKVKEACDKGNNMIIVQNTHMRKFEMQQYIDYAAQYNYTVIMAITTRRFEVNPEILEKTNTQGLTKEYFRRRLKQWEEVTPRATGWFLCPEDTLYVFSQVHCSLEALLDDGKFCRLFDVYDKETLLNRYKARRQLYCKAAYCHNANGWEMKKYYLSDEVQNYYGKTFDILLDGFIITKDVIVAVVEVECVTEGLTLDAQVKKKKNNSSSDLADRFEMLQVNPNLTNHNTTVELNQDFCDLGKTVQLLDRKEEEVFNAEDYHFIFLAHKESVKLEIDEVEELSSALLVSFSDEHGNIEASKFIELSDGTNILRLSDEAWYIQTPKKIQLESVFTGLYI